MKKYVTIILSILSMLLLCCCGKAQSEELTVYVVETESLYTTMLESFSEEESASVSTLNVVSFETYEEMEEQMNAELMAGKGPDVVLCNSFYSGLDPYKSADSGMFLPLDEYMEELEADSYFAEIFESGRMSGQQYYLPLSWNVSQAYADEAIISESGYNCDLYEMILSEEEKYREDAERGAVVFNRFGNQGALQDLLDAAGVEVFDTENGEITAQEEQVREMTDFLKAVTDELSSKTSGMVKKYQEDFQNVVSHITFQVENFPFMNNLRHYQTLYEKNADCRVYCTYFERKDGGMNAQVVQYGAINANTANEEGAWELLKYILDAPAGNMSVAKKNTALTYYAPVRKDVFDSYLVQIGSSVAPGPGMKVGPLPVEYVEMLRNLSESVKGGVIPNVVYGALVEECMEPYLTGEGEFADCYDNLINRTKLYLGE